MLSRANKNSRVPDGDGVYTSVKIMEVYYERIVFLIV